MLQRHELANALVAEGHQVVERLTLEWRALGRSLKLDEPAITGFDDVHVDVGAGIFLVREVEHRHAADHADARRRDVVVHGDRLDLSRFAHPLHGEHHRDKPAGDRGGARPPVRLDDVAVDPDGALAKFRQARHRSQRAANQPLDLLSASANFACRGLALRARRGCARQHAVFGGDPTLPRVPEERRNAVLDARRADDAGPSDFDEDRAFCVKEESRCEFRRPQFRRHPSVATCHVSPLSVLTHFRFFSRGCRRSTCPASVSTSLPSMRICTRLTAGRLVVSALTIE